MTFANPLAFLLLLLLPVLLLWEFRKRRDAVRFSSTDLPQASGSSLRARLRNLPLFLRFLVLLLLIIALARPQQGLEKIQDVSKGIAIEMVVDRSSSMGTEFDFQGKSMTRLDAVKEIFADFVLGNGSSLKGRSDDLVGLLRFARFADTVCPLTLAHGPLNKFLETVKLVDRRDEDGTAIGDAVSLAAARLRTAEDELRKAGKGRTAYQIKSKVIILLTDGENNMGNYSPEQAASLAKKWGIKIYAIGVGGDETMQIRTLFGTQTIRTGQGVDKETLSKLATETGGKFWLAEDGESLQKIYQEIDRLEKSEVQSVRYVDYRERFFPFAVAALLLLFLETTLRATWLRRLP